MKPRPKTTHRGTNDDGETQVRKSFSVSRDNLKIWKDENDSGTEVTMIEVPISSNSEDRDGDAFNSQGLEDQLAQLESGTVGMWLDHGLSAATGWPDYRILEQIGGWKGGRIENETLYGKAALRPSSEEAAELETMIDEGVAPVSFSVGFIVQSENEREDIPGKEFESVDLLEVSAVGIPSNPDAVTNSASAMAKAISNQEGIDVDSDSLARDIAKAARSPFLDDEETDTKMQMKYNEEMAEEAIDGYLQVDETDASDPITSVINWAEEALSEEHADELEDAAEEALPDSDAEELGDLPVSAVSEEVASDSDSDDDDDGSSEESDGGDSSGESGGEDDDDDSEENSGSDGGKSGSSEEIRSAIKATLPEAMLSEDEFRSMINEELRSVLADEESDVELSVDLNDDSKEALADEMAERLFDGSSAESKASKPSPAGTISTYDNDEKSESGSNEGDSENSRTPSPNLGN